MGVVGDFLIMPGMALIACHPPLVGVPKPGCFRVTGRAANFRVLNALIGCDIDGGYLFPGHDLGPGAAHCVAVETERINFYLCSRFSPAGQAVAKHTGCIIIRKGGQGRLFIMAGTALFTNGLFRIKRSQFILIKQELVVGIMAFKTVCIVFRVLDLRLTMKPLIQIFLDMIMTGEALVHTEKMTLRFRDIRGIRVKPAIGGILMAVLTGRLSMDGNVEFFPI